MYVCLLCKSKNVSRRDGISEKYLDDYLLDCHNCGNWEQVGSKAPATFEVIENEKADLREIDGASGVYLAE